MGALSIEPFKAYKAERALDAVAQSFDVLRSVVDHVSAYSDEYAIEHRITITRDEVETEQAEAELGLEANAEDEEAAEALANCEKALKMMGDRDKIIRPGIPSQAEVLMATFPKVWELAPEVVTELIALAVIPNDDLKQAWMDGGDDAATALIKAKSGEIRFDLDVPEILELASETAERCALVVEQSKDAVGKLRATGQRLMKAMGLGNDQDSDDESRASVTASDAPTDGTPSESSSGSPTDTSAISAAA